MHDMGSFFPLVVLRPTGKGKFTRKDRKFERVGSIKFCQGNTVGSKFFSVTCEFLCKYIQTVPQEFGNTFQLIAKFIYSEKATKFCEIFLLLLITVHTVKSKGKISKNVAAFSEYMNFTFIY